MKKQLIGLILLLLIPGFMLGQDVSVHLQKAQGIYDSGSFSGALDYLSTNASETSLDNASKSKVAGFISDISVREYNNQNFLNAYTGFKKALKYDPTNAQSTQYFLKMRKEMDVTNLTNKGPVVKGTDPVATATPASGTDGQTGTTNNNTASNIQLSDLEKQLADADKRLGTMESSVNSSNSENQLLRDQINQQIQLIQSMSKSQSAQNVPGQTSQQTEEQKQMLADTMKILVEMAERDSKASTEKAATDSAVAALVQKMDEQQTNLKGSGFVTNMILIFLIIFAAALIFLIVFLIIIAVRSGKRRTKSDSTIDSVNYSTYTMLGQGYRQDSIEGQEMPPMLEYSGSEHTEEGQSDNDPLIKRDLKKAEHLRQMYDEVKSGTLNWKTIKNYIGDLEVSLRSEILKVVEQKLNEGDLLTNESVIPVLFPFLTDYDDFIREKSENLARRALTENTERTPKKLTKGSKKLIEDDSDPLNLKNLMIIPEKLKILFKGQDQTLITSKLCRGIGKALGYSNDDCNDLYKAALLHDCGYLMLDQDRLQKIISKNEISDEDFAYIQTHPERGFEYFGEFKLPENMKSAILCHHERNDGTGYPSGLKKDDIPQFAKIIGTAETFAALISKRAYREKRDIQHALAIISDGARSKFDAEIVEALGKVATATGSLT